MNIQGDIRYVTQGDVLSFDPTLQRYPKYLRPRVNPGGYTLGLKLRQQAFAKDGIFGKRIRDSPMAYRIGGSIFVVRIYSL
jgi:hypothetical protein